MKIQELNIKFENFKTINTAFFISDASQDYLIDTIEKEKITKTSNNDVFPEVGLLNENHNYEKFNIIFYNMINHASDSKFRETMNEVFANMILLRKSSSAPIILLGEKTLEEIIEVDHKQLFHKLGFYYYSLKTNDAITVVPITPYLWEDLKYFICTNKGFLNDLYHKIKDLMLKPEYESILIEGFNTIRKVFAEDLIKPQEFIDIEDKILKEIASASDRRKLLETHKTNIFECFDLPLDDIFFNPKKSQPAWEVLYLDDNQQDCLVLKSKFKEKGVECHTYNNANEALAVLNNPEKNAKIFVVISDYRLEDEQGYWQPIQGYDFLDNILNSPKISPMGCFMLTGKISAIRLHAKQFQSFSVPWFSKEDVTTKGGFNIFFNAVKEVGDFFESKRDILTAKVWIEKTTYNAHPLRDYYKEYIQKEYKHISPQIDKTSRNLIVQAAFVNLNLTAMINKSDLITIGNQETSLTLPLRKSKIVDDLPRFYLRLIGRRAYYGISNFVKKNDEDWVLKTLLKKNEKDDVNNSQNYKSSYLAIISSDNTPFQPLKEEYEWFKQFDIDIQLERKNIIEDIENIMFTIAEKLEAKYEHIKHLPNFKRAFYKNKREISQRLEDVKTFLEVDEDYKEIKFDFVELLKTVLHDPEKAMALYRDNSQLLITVYDLVQEMDESQNESDSNSILQIRKR